MNEEQLKQAKVLASEIFSIMQDSVKDLWRKEDAGFLGTLAQDVAKEKILAETSDKPEEHLQNLRHLAATIQGEIVRRSLKIKAFSRELFIQILTAIIKTVAITVLKSIMKS